jgi:hypothetical protein
MDSFASPAALDGARRSALRRLLGSWFLVLLFLAVLVLGCKKSTPATLIPGTSSTKDFLTRDFIRWAPATGFCKSV